MYWGASYWRYLHYFALNDNSERRQHIKQLVEFIPCEQCKTEWVEPSDEEDLVMWSKELHNKVNKKLGKYDKWDMIDFGISHKNKCDKCENMEYIHSFPWVFIHTVAETGGVNALQYLKSFNELYPCEICRGNFFTDDPLEDETILQWTIRHHNRINVERGLPEYVHYTPQSSAPCEGCTAVTAGDEPV